MLRKIVAAALSCLLGTASFLSPSTANAQASLTGQWTRLQDFPVIPIHSHLLPSGKVMMWGRPGNQGYLWDPATQAITALPDAGYDVFCAGHAFLADGRLLVAGGHIAGQRRACERQRVRPGDECLVEGARHERGTLVSDSDDAAERRCAGDIGPDRHDRRAQSATAGVPGRDQHVAGLDECTVEPAHVPEDVRGAEWQGGHGRTFGRHPLAGHRRHRRMDLVGLSKFGYRDANSAAMYADGKILVMGGGDPPPGPVAEVIDLNVPAPAWRAVASMSAARRHHNATLLPDGTVLVTGGTSGSGYNDPTSPVFAAESWNPATETWTTLASASVPRLYHSTALLLPDGRVITGGGDGHPEAEVFSPPYLFKGARPVMSAVPASIGYGQQVTVQSPDAASIQKVTLIRLASVTHGFDQNQRMTTLQFTPGTGTLDITAPANANLAPPGHYMLFIVNGNGVPSVGAIVQIGTAAPPPPAPILGSLAPSSATAGGPPSRSPPMAAISFRGRRCAGMARPARRPLSAALS